MKPKFSFISSRINGLASVIFIGSLVSASLSQATTFYWDQNAATVGFGTGTGTWAEDNTSPGPGKWTTSATGILAGSLTQSTGNTDIFNFGTASLGLAAGTITVSGTVNMGNTNYGSASGAIVLSGGTIAFSAAPTITVSNTTDRIGSVISGAATSFTKAGAGILVLNGANTYSGSTIINGGTLDLGGSTATGSLSSTVLTLSGGSLSYTRTGGTTQAFTTTNINAGMASALSVVSGNTLNLGTVVRGAGGALDFSTTGSGTVAALATSNTAGIMSGFTVGNSWAVANGAGVAISGLAGASYTLSSVAGTIGTNYDGNNIDVDNSAGILDAGINANSLRFSSAAANTMTLTGTNTITTGGILVGSGVGANLSTITGGTLTGAANKDLIIIQNNTLNGLTISSDIVNNTSTSITKSGAGLLTLAGTNTFTGGLSIFSGTVALGSSGALNSTADSENAVTFTSGSTGTLAMGGNSTVIRSLNTNAAAPGTAIVENASGSNAILTIGNSGNANSSFAGVIQNGTGSGTLALTKVGSGTLALSGANSYTGGTTLNGAGAVIISNATSFGAGDVLVTGTSRINATGGITYGNAIDVGAVLSLQNATISANTAEFTGVLSGSSNINLINSGSGNAQTNLYFSNANNTFTGSVIGPAGNASGSDYFQFNSIGDGGNFTFDKGGNRGGVIYSGASAIEFNTRQIAIGTSFGGGGTYGVNGNNAVQNAFQNNATDPAHTVTFNADMAMTSIASSSVFYFDGSNTGNNTFSGTIGDPTGANTLGIGKTGAGKWLLTGANSFEGNAIIANGTLSVNTLDIAANNQALGKGSLILLGFISTNGILEFTGSTNSTTDKQIQIGNTVAAHTGAGSILNNGTGSLTFTSSTFNPTITGITATRTLTLGGSYTGAANEIQGIIQDNAAAGKVALTKADASTWTLSGANTYTGATAVTGGKLLISGSTSTGLVSVANGATLGGTGDIGGSVSVASGATLSPGASIESLKTGALTMASGSTFAYEAANNTATGADLLGVNGALSLTNVTLNFDLATAGALAGGGWTVGDKLTLISYGGTAITSGFAGYADNTNYNFGSNVWTFDYDDTAAGKNFAADLTGSNRITLTAFTIVPEPSAALLGGLGLLALLRRRRHHN